MHTAGQRLLAPAILAIMAFTMGCMTGLTTHQGGVSGDEGFDGVDSPEQDQETQGDETADTGGENTGGEDTGDENTG
ncbi:MAG TPA: hypothetical protein DIU15_06120, partial [Deltaproteobacteria bacterium]|nr:hypothetical protein [Deltaproteobacteria bacterium]